MKVFSKQKMLERLEKEGRSHLVDEESANIMDALDGKEAFKNDFKALVYDELEYYVRYRGQNFPVNPEDCIEK
jgi:hypothetical protein